MKIISWNVNGIRAVLKKWFVEWVKIENPDILCLQEVKAFETQIPTEIRFGFQDYNYVWHRSERPWYAWTAIFYKKNIEGVETKNSFDNPECFNDDWRVTSLSRWDYTLFNIYFPNWWDRADWTPMLWYKLNFYEEYIKHVTELAKEWRKVLTTWDFNICHEEIDIARPKENENSIWFLPIERQEMDWHRPICRTWRQNLPSRQDEADRTDARSQRLQSLSLRSRRKRNQNSRKLGRRKYN